MGIAYFIALDTENPGFDTFVNGKAIAREVEAITGITTHLKLANINDLTSFAGLAEQFGVDPDSEGAKETWFDAAEGLRWVRALHQHIDSHPQSVNDRTAVLEDLKEFEALLTNAERINAKWHFEMDI